MRQLMIHIITAAMRSQLKLPVRRRGGDYRYMLNRFTKEARLEIAELAAKTFDVIVAVGPASAVYESALKHRFAKKNVWHVKQAEEILPRLRDIIEDGDLVLVKASHSVGLQRAVVLLQEV
jgi:UDP-N-acetylmuramyl pentapeptide synthase